MKSKILSIVKAYRKHGMQYVPIALQGEAVPLSARNGRKAIFSSARARKNGGSSKTKFLVWLYWQDTGKPVFTRDFKLFEVI